MTQAILDKLAKALDNVDRPGSFCVSGSVPAVLPGLVVNGLGAIALPLTATQAKELAQLCEQAPYGKGEETVVDTSVRRVWRMEPGHFAVTNPDWEKLLLQTVGAVQAELGLEKQTLECHLYDLLLYEPGSFFLPHRDGEKLERMVATLVVVLPSSYEGGELVVRHDGVEKIVDFGGDPNSAFQIHFAAFYADCEHEIRPLRKGHRLCLVYNLTLAKAETSIGAPRNTEHIGTVSEILRAWAADETSCKIAITLEHRYTKDGLAWDALKGVDRAKADVLVEAARLADCKAHLALLTFHEMGSPEYDGGGHGYGRGRSRWNDEEEDEDEGEEEDAGGGSKHEMGEVHETSLTADHWCDSEGQRVPIGELTVDEAEVLDYDTIKDVTPEEEYEGFTGNASMTLDHWYRHAVIFIWPERRHFEILCDRNGRNVVPVLQRMVAQWKKSSRKNADALKAQCLKLAAAMLATWKENPYGGGYPPKPEVGDPLKILADLADSTLIDTFLGEVVVKDVEVDPGNSLAAVCQKLGWGTFQTSLLAIMKSTATPTLERNVRVLEHLCTASTPKTAGWINLCESLASELLSAIEGLDRKQESDGWMTKASDRSEVLAGLTRALVATEQFDLLSRAITHALQTPKKYPLTATHVPALSRLQPWLQENHKKPCAVVSQWIASCREQLEELTAQAPKAPADFRRPAAVDCKCADCGDLRTFLANPREEAHRFTVRQDRRSHLENTIRDNHCDLDCKTDKRGSPQTLVCTKNTNSYQRKLKTYHENQEHLATILAIQASLAGTSVRRKGR